MYCPECADSENRIRSLERLVAELQAKPQMEARAIRAELLAVIQRRARSSDISAVSDKWLAAFAPELERGEFGALP